MTGVLGYPFTVKSEAPKVDEASASVVVIVVQSLHCVQLFAIPKDFSTPGLPSTSPSPRSSPTSESVAGLTEG